MPDSTEGIQDIADTLREHGDRLVVSPGDGEGFDQTTAWVSDPGEDVRRTERTKQAKARESQADPAPHLSDDEVMRRLGYA